MGALLPHSSQISSAQAVLSISPAYVYITEHAPHGSFVLRNEGREQVEVIVRARFGVIEADSTTLLTQVVLGSAGHMGNLVDRLTFFPDRLILDPGKERVVRFMVLSPEELSAGAHIALLYFEMQQRAAVASSQVPEVATALNIVYNLVAPVVLIKGQGAPHLQARMLHATEDSLELLLTNKTPFPFVGGISVVQNDQKLGRIESAVYTRRKLTIPLWSAPADSSLTLEFDNRYTGLPASLRNLFVLPAPINIPQ